MAQWKKKSLRLKDDHAWRGKPGYRIFAADRGAVRFNFPQDWVVIPDTDSIKFHDLPPPDDNCRLEFSYMRLPPIDWSALPLPRLVESIVEGEERELLSRGEIVHVRRHHVEVAWVEIRFLDPTEQREACSRLCLARRANIQSLLTFDFWPEDLPRLDPVWEEVVSSLDLGRYVKDPTRGQ